MPTLLPTNSALQVGVAGAAGVLFALSAYAPLRSLPFAALSAAVSWAVYATLAAAGVGAVVAAALAAAVLGFAAMIVPRTVGIPPLVLVVAGITPLLPGLTLYRGFTELALEAVSNSAVTILLALTFSLALAAGVSFGEQVGWPIAQGLRRAVRRLRGLGPEDTTTIRVGRRGGRRPRVF